MNTPTGRACPCGAIGTTSARVGGLSQGPDGNGGVARGSRSTATIAGACQDSRERPDRPPARSSVDAGGAAGCVVGDAGARRRAGPCAPSASNSVDQRERQVARLVARPTARRRRRRRRASSRSPRPAARSRSERQPPLADDPLGLLGDDAEVAGRRCPRRRAAGCTRRCGRSPRDSRCARGRAAAPSSQVASPVLQDLVDARADLGPDLRPHLAAPAGRAPTGASPPSVMCA